MQEELPLNPESALSLNSEMKPHFSFTPCNFRSKFRFRLQPEVIYLRPQIKHLSDYISTGANMNEFPLQTHGFRTKEHLRSSADTVKSC